VISVAVFCLDLELYLCFLGFLETVNLVRLTTPRGSTLAIDCGEVVAKSSNLQLEIPSPSEILLPVSSISARIIIIANRFLVRVLNTDSS